MEPSEQDSFFNSYINNNEYSTYGWAESKCPLNNNNTTSNIEQNIHEYASRTRNKRLNIQEPERMMHDIKIHQLKKEEKSRNEIIIKEINELQECTFKPSLTNSFLSYEKQRKNSDNYEDKEESPVVIRGLGRYLELKYLSKKQKEEALERERNAFNVKNIEKYRRPEDGSTIVEVNSSSSCSSSCVVMGDSTLLLFVAATTTTSVVLYTVYRMYLLLIILLYMHIC